MVIFFPENPAGSKCTESSLNFYAMKNKNGEFLTQPEAVGTGLNSKSGVAKPQEKVL